jgi:epoxyqueuosine reductase
MGFIPETERKEQPSSRVRASALAPVDDFPESHPLPHPLGVECYQPAAAPLDAVGSSGLNLANALRGAALDLGFARVGFCSVEPFETAAQSLAGWLSAGLHGEMQYLAEGARHQPQALLGPARSLVVVALAYRSAGSERALPVLTGRVARYSQGADYHAVLRGKLQALAQLAANLVQRPVLAPLLEREAARRAGVGFTAKSTLTLAPGVGTFTLLGELLLDVDLPASTPIAEGCGQCTACLRACPTGAFVDAYTLDARRCISYLTIELQGSIPRALRPLMGAWVFGCDVCQDVCPYNALSPRAPRAGTGCTARRAAALGALGAQFRRLPALGAAQCLEAREPGPIAAQRRRRLGKFGRAASHPGAPRTTADQPERAGSRALRLGPWALGRRRHSRTPARCNNGSRPHRVGRNSALLGRSRRGPR